MAWPRDDQERGAAAVQSWIFTVDFVLKFVMRLRWTVVCDGDRLRSIGRGQKRDHMVCMLSHEIVEEPENEGSEW
jgi:hypothetical protein